LNMTSNLNINSNLNIKSKSKSYDNSFIVPKKHSNK